MTNDESTISEVAYDSGDSPSSVPVQAVNGAEPAQSSEAILDINDPRLNEVQVDDYDPQADLNMFIPAPDGAHLSRVGFQENQNGPSLYWGKYQGKDVLYALLECTIDQPGEKFHNQPIRGFAWSAVDPNTGTSSLYDLCAKAGYPVVDPETGLSYKGQGAAAKIMAHVSGVINGHPHIMIITQWRGECNSCRETFISEHGSEYGDTKSANKAAGKEISKKKYLNGMSRWPQTNLNGENVGHAYPLAICLECGAGDQSQLPGSEPIRARAEISRFAKVPVQQ